MLKRHGGHNYTICILSADCNLLQVATNVYQNSRDSKAYVTRFVKSYDKLLLFELQITKGHVIKLLNLNTCENIFRERWGFFYYSW